MEFEMMETRNPEIFPDKESGSSSFLLIIMISGATFLGVQFLQTKTANEVRSQASQELRTDRSLARASLRTNISCSDTNLSPCTVGQIRDVMSRSGGVFLNRNGQSRIGAWNVRLECINDNGPRLWFMHSRPDGNNGFMRDPLNNQLHDWQRLMRADEVCSGNAPPPPLLLRSEACYGLLEGLNQTPNRLRAQCPECSSEQLQYCADTQRDFPDCPEGYVRTFIYVDRYGWGGRDLSKYSQCERR